VKKHTIKNIEQKKEIWLYIDFPLLALDAALADIENIKAESAIAVASVQKNVQRIVCCNSYAQKWGVDPDLSLSTALAICPDLLVLSRSPGQENLLLHRLALIAYQFSPAVIINNSGIWLELSGCDQLFQGYSKLLQRLHRQILFLSVTATTGIAMSALAAQLLCGQQFQYYLPNEDEMYRNLMTTKLFKLPGSQKQKNNFKQLGLENIGDLLALPRSALSQRFSAELLETLSLLNGEKPCTLKRFTPPIEFSDEIQIPHGLYNKDSLLFYMKTLLQRFCVYLMARQRHCRKFVWHFEPLFGERQSMSIILSISNNNWSSLLTLSRLQLERLDLPQSIEKISLFSDQFTDMPEPSFDLFGDQVALNNQASTLMDNLYARLGIEALSQPSMSEEHLPEKAGGMSPPNRVTNINYPTSKAPQPLWLLTNPVRIQLRNHQLYWRQTLTIISGPERLCGNSWQTEQQRDYYLACDSKGARYWLFRESMNKQWFVHGLFS
jgi:protein ImuB|tara:strand:- start:160 stop:1644 length:1485 start_codon:yes stop_codon:yes gene_type:complete